MANFGASENCGLLLCLKVMRSKTCSVGLVGSMCQLTPLSVGNLLVNFLPVGFLSPF